MRVTRLPGRVVAVVGGILLLAAAGCMLPWIMLLDQLEQSTVAGDLTGYWMSVATSQVETESDVETPNDVDTDFWKFTPVTTSTSEKMYSVTHPCAPEDIVAYAYLYEDGTVVIADIDSGVSVVAEFYNGDADSLHALDPVDDAVWTAYRVEEPNCSDIDDAGMLMVGMQPIEFADDSPDIDEEEALQAKSVNAQSYEEEELLMGLGFTVPNGLVHMTHALGSRLSLTEEFERPAGAATSNCTSNGQAIDCNQPAAHAGYVQCVDQGLSAGRTQQLADVAALLDTDQVYPGALLQGKYFDGGSFVPLTIPRSGGTLTMSGLYGTNATFSRKLDTISYANVNDAIVRILSDNKIEGTTANVSYRVEAANSSSEWAFQLGTHVKTIGVDLTASVDAGRKSNRNTVVMKFTQVFYTVSYADPMRRTDVFADGENFDDPEDQIAKGNPPLYVSNVKYGRQVFFFATSSESSTYVKAALNGAYNGVAATVKVDGKMSYKDVMARTEISYIARGGDAGLALEPLKTAKPEELYDRIREALANRNAATWSPSNPGIPVAYTIRYLDDRSVAIKGFTTSYDRHDCHLVEAVNHKFKLFVDWIDNDVRVWCDNVQVGYKKGGSYTGDISAWLPDDGRDHTIKLELRNGDCFKTHAIFQVWKDGALVYNERFAPCCWRCCGKQAEIHFVVNAASGRFEVVYHWTGNGA